MSVTSSNPRLEEIVLKTSKMKRNDPYVETYTGLLGKSIDT